MHAAVLSGFPPDTQIGRVLWRVDWNQGHQPALYVVSQGQPDFAHLDEQAGWPTRRMAESTDYSPFLSGLARGQVWGFRLRANPTHRVKVGDQSKVLAHVTVAQQIQWLMDRAEGIGVELGHNSEGESLPAVELVDRDVLRFRRKEAMVTLATATFTGRLLVREPELLSTALTSGIGRAKAYGCGLMTLARQ